MYSHPTNTLVLLAPAVSMPVGDLCAKTPAVNYYTVQTVTGATSCRPPPATTSSCGPLHLAPNSVQFTEEDNPKAALYENFLSEHAVKGSSLDKTQYVHAAHENTVTNFVSGFINYVGTT